MRYLVTGHTGFKGAWLVQLLHAAGHEVCGLGLDPGPNSLFESARVRDLLAHDMRVDIRDAAATSRVVSDVAPDVVVHLAAQALVRESYRDPRTTWETNVNGTYNVLDAVAAAEGVRALLVITTDKVYRNVNQIWGYRETDSLGGSDPYSASKAAADLLTQSWIASSGGSVPTAIARAGNVVGGGDVCAERLMVDLVAAFSGQRDVHLRYPHAVRPWQHVLDCLNGYLAIVGALCSGQQAGEAFNIGPGTSSFVEVADVARAVARRWETTAGVVVDTSPGLPEAGLLALDARKCELRLGWRNRLGFDTTIDWTVDWARRASQGEDPRSLCQEQIARFGELAGQEVR